MSDDFGLIPVDKLPIPPKHMGSEIVVRESHEIQEYRGRPRVWRDMFICAKCDKEPDEMGQYTAAATTGRGSLGQVTKEDGYLHGYCKCHGAFCEFMAPFAQAWAAIDSRQKIRVFEPENELPDGPHQERHIGQSGGDQPPGLIGR